jgi:hypothetical protein
MDVHKTVVVSASLGGFDKQFQNVPQSVPHDFHLFTDENFPPRDKSMSPRLQAKIPKCFAFELLPGYDAYLWLDGNLRFPHPESLRYYLDALEGYDLVVLRHPNRPNIRQEVRYTRKGINQQSNYILSRYPGEFLKEQYEVIEKDKRYVDDLLVIGGIFLYRNTPQVQAMLKEWFYYQTRYIVQDQISFPYVIKNSGVKYNVLEDVYDQTPYLTHIKHKYR